ncbi:MAG: carboxypeptidase-like regulatory domain-containing protein [Oligoflexia bacterium]|nr:carboxypeptidase-like regulatory domain-containing protein [Oligoflexia bacterium]
MHRSSTHSLLVATCIALVVAMAALLSACGGGTRGTTDTTIEVRGLLIDSNGQPLAGVQVKAGTEDSVTDSQGAFLLYVPPGADQLSFSIGSTELVTTISPVQVPVALSLQLNTENTAVVLVDETPLEEATPTPVPTAAETNTPGPVPSTPTPTPQPSATPTTIPAQISLSVNQTSFSSFQTAIFSISALGGVNSSVNGNSIVLVLGTLGSGQTTLTFANNVTVDFPTSSSDIYFILSIQNYVQTMQNGSVVFNLPVDVVSEPTTLFARAVAVEPGTNALLAQSAQINITLVPQQNLQ